MKHMRAGGRRPQHDSGAIRRKRRRPELSDSSADVRSVAFTVATRSTTTRATAGSGTCGRTGSSPALSSRAISRRPCPMWSAIPFGRPLWRIRATIPDRAPRRTLPARIQRESWIWTGGGARPRRIGRKSSMATTRMRPHRCGAARTRGAGSATTRSSWMRCRAAYAATGGVVARRTNKAHGVLLRQISTRRAE